ncbi:hypothetical protein QEN19_001212 [Hanseniaspora menglaensis]
MGSAVSKCCLFIFDKSEDTEYHNRENQQLLLKQQQDNYLHQQQMSMQKEEQEKLKQMKRQQKLLEKESLLTNIVNIANDSYLDVGIIENIENIMVSNGVIIDSNDLNTKKVAEIESLDYLKSSDDNDILIYNIETYFKNKQVTKGISLFNNDYSLFLDHNPSILLKDPKITAELFSNKLDVYKNVNNKVRSSIIQLHNKEFKQFETLVDANFIQIESKKKNGELGSLLLKT